MTPTLLEAGREGRRFSSGLFLALLIALLGLPALTAGAVQAEEGVNQAGLVVRLSDDDWVARCVSFPEEEISGYELLARSGLAAEVAFQSMGVSVCRIEGLGCDQADCFCQCRGGGECIYWSYWQLAEDGWRYARAGAASHRVGHGAVDGWAWGPGTVTDAPQPPLVAFEEICAGQIASPAGLASEDVTPPPTPLPETVVAASPAASWLTYLPLLLILPALLFLLLKAQRKRYGS